MVSTQCLVSNNAWLVHDRRVCLYKHVYFQMASTIKLLPRYICPVVTRQFSLKQANFCNFFRVVRCTSNEASTTQSQGLTCFNSNSKIDFRQFDPRRNDRGDNLLQRSKNSLSFLKGFQKSFTFRRKDEKPKNQKRRVPKLILIQNPLTWLMIKIDFSVLRNIWDPSFEEKEFKFGTKQVNYSPSLL